MKCKVSTSIPELQELIDKYGQKLGFDYYLHGEPKEDISDLIGGSEKKFLPKEQDRINREEQKLYDLRQTLKALEDPKDIKVQKVKIEKQAILITNLKEQLEQFKSQRVVEDVYNQAELNLADLERLFNQDSLSWDELVYSKDLISFWQAAGEFPLDKDHLFLESDEVDTPEIKERFIQYKNRVDVYAERYLSLAKTMLATEASKVHGKNITKEELFKAQLDAWNLSVQTLNLGRLNQDLLNTIYSTVEQISAKAEMEASERWEDIDGLATKAMPGIKKIAQRLGLKTPWDIFRQKRSDGKETGNMVFRFSQDYFDQSTKLFNDALRLSKAVKTNEKPELSEVLKKSSKKAWKAFYDWKTNNTITLDVRKLFPDEAIEESELPEEFIYNRKTYADNIIEDHKNYLIKQLGVKGYELYYKSQLDKIEEFKSQREVTWGQINLEDIPEAEKKAKMEDWLRTNSPYWALDMEESEVMRTRKDGSYYNASYAYNKYIPLRYYESGKSTGWYDSNFDLIEQEPEVLEFYDLILKLLGESKQMLGESADHMQMNSIPFIKNQIIDMFMERGMVTAGTGIYNKFLESLRSDDLSTEDRGRLNPLTGSSDKELSIRILTERKDEIKAIKDLKIAKYRLENKSDPDYNQKKVFEQEAIDELAKEKSFDLVRIMKAYTLASLSYKYKSSIEPFIRTADDMFRQIHKAKTNRSGDPLSQDGVIVTDEKLVNMQAALDYYLDSKFWGKPKQKMELVSKKKIYNTEEAKEKKELEELRDQLKESLSTSDAKLIPKIESDIKNVEFQINNLGGNITGSQIGNNLLKYVQLKGMGFNVMGAVSNVGFGLISNWIQAGDRRLFTQAELRKGYLMATSSIAKFYSFNQLELGQSNKIRNLMDKLDILSESSKELFERGIQSSIMKKTKSLSPYNLNQRAEYINQAPILIAMMLHNNMWDQFDNDGNLKPDATITQEDIIKFKLKVNKVIESTHGDYKNPLKAKETFVGRSLLQFRTWMLEGFANRFESYKYDPILELDRKGRYRTSLPVLSIVSYAKVEGMSPLKQVLFNLKQLGRKLLFQKTQYDEAGFNEVDAANMRKNLNEMLVYLTLLSLGIMLAAGLDDDDDEEKNLKTMAYNTLLNTTFRMQTDILFYSSPGEFQKLNKNVLPIFQIVNDGYKLTDAVVAQFGSSPNMESGLFEGTNRLAKATGEAIPFTNQYLKLYKTSNYILGAK
jgi:hypothetical protein